jgi:hypothetical protein
LLSALTTQTLAPSKASPSGNCPTGKRTDQRSIAFSQLGHGVAAEVRDPDVGAIEDHSLRQASHRKGAQDSTRAGERLGDVVASLIGHPHIHSIEGNPLGRGPIGNVPMTLPSDAQTFVTLLLPRFTTQMLAPSNATEIGEEPTGKLLRALPSLARNLVTLPVSWSATQIFAPSNAIPVGNDPAANSPNEVPSLARSFVTLLDVEFATQMLLPSKAACPGPWPTEN